ncbi:MAG: DnaJ domain-containing protein [Opitutaceae bacterium]
MSQFSLTDLIIVLFLSLVVGYFLISLLIPERIWKNLRKRNRSHSRGGQDHREPAPPGSRPSSNRTSTLTMDHPDRTPTEREYARILGLSGRVTLYQIKLAYRHEMAKYHPDKVNHLAPEFQELARERTRLIRSAYEYFRSRYGK